MKNGELEMGPHVALDSFIRAFCDIKGIGEWTANYVAMRALRDPNAFPHSDLILLRAAANKGESLTPSGLREKARPWQPWRAYAVLLLWRGYAGYTT